MSFGRPPSRRSPSNEARDLTARVAKDAGIGNIRLSARAQARHGLCSLGKNSDNGWDDDDDEDSGTGDGDSSQQWGRRTPPSQSPRSSLSLSSSMSTSPRGSRPSSPDSPTTPRGLLRRLVSSGGGKTSPARGGSGGRGSRGSRGSSGIFHVGRTPTPAAGGKGGDHRHQQQVRPQSAPQHRIRSPPPNPARPASSSRLARSLSIDKIVEKESKKYPQELRELLYPAGRFDVGKKGGGEGGEGGEAGRSSAGDCETDNGNDGDEPSLPPLPSSPRAGSLLNLAVEAEETGGGGGSYNVGDQHLDQMEALVRQQLEEQRAAQQQLKSLYITSDAAVDATADATADVTAGVTADETAGATVDATHATVDATANATTGVTLPNHEEEISGVHVSLVASKAGEASSSGGGGGPDGQCGRRGGKHDSGHENNNSDDSVDDGNLSDTQLPRRRRTTLTGSISVSTRGMGGDFAESKIAPDGSTMTLALVTTDQVRFFWATAVRVLLFFVCPPLFFFPLWRDFKRHGKGTMFQLRFFHLGALCWPVLAISLWYTYASPVDVGNEPTHDRVGKGPPMYGGASTTGNPTEEAAHGRVTSRMMLQEILFTSSLPAYVTAALFCVAKASFGYTHRADDASGDSGGGGDGNSRGTSSSVVGDCRGGSEVAAPTQIVGAAASRFLLKYVLTEEYQVRGRARTPRGLIAWWMLFSRFLASPYVVVWLWEVLVVVVQNRARSEQLDLGAGEHASCGVAGGVSIACGGFCVMQQRCQPTQAESGLPPPPPSSSLSFSMSSVSLQAIVATFADTYGDGDGSRGSDGGGGIGRGGEGGSAPGVNALWMWLTLLAAQQIAIGHIIFLCLESIYLYKLRLRSQRRFNRQTEDAPVRRPNDCGGDGGKGRQWTRRQRWRR